MRGNNAVTVPPPTALLTPKQGIQFLGILITLLAVMLIVVSLTIRGTITPLEAIGLWLLVVGIWIYAKA